MGLQINIGDVFFIPIDENTGAVGQVADAWNEEVYLAVFDKLQLKDNLDFRHAVVEKPLFLTLSLDGKIWNGHWPVLGNVVANLSDIPQPNYKVRRDGVIYIESRDRTYTRKAAPNEIEHLLFRTVSSPMIVEKAVKAHFGVGEWKPAYDELLAEHAVTSSRLS